MNPTPSDAHVDALLTNFSVAYIQDQSRFIASRVFPNIPVQKQSDRYLTYNRGDFNRDEMELRPPATETAGGGYDIDNTPTYFCPVYGVHKDIDDQLRANADNPMNLDREATIWCTQKALIRKEKLWVANFFGTGIWGTDMVGVASGPTGNQFLKWSDAASTPIEDIRAGKTAVSEATGFEPNKLVLGQKVWDKLADHPDIVDRIKYSGGVGPDAPAIVKRMALAQLLELESIEIAKAVENTAAKGQTDVGAFIAGSNALLCYTPPSPGIMTPSAGYTFSWTGLFGAGAEGNRIKRFRMENLSSDRVEIEMAWACKKIGADLGYFFSAAI